MNAVGPGRDDRGGLRRAPPRSRSRARCPARSCSTSRRPTCATLKYFRLVQTTVRDIPVTISRTGYTGDLGYELWVDAERAVALWDALMACGEGYGITPAGIWALDIARIEAGLVMLDVDYFSAHHALIEDQKSFPDEINLGVDGEPGQRSVQRSPCTAESAGGEAGVGVRRHRGELGVARAAVRGAWAAAAAA